MSNSISEIQKFVQDTLNSLLGSLNDGFADNELAYLSSQGKNELQVRDKLHGVCIMKLQRNMVTNMLFAVNGVQKSSAGRKLTWRYWNSIQNVQI